MNIFVIPTWYPHEASPVAGIFFKEQSVALGECRPSWNVAISVWGQEAFTVSPRTPVRTGELLKRYVASRGKSKSALAHNVIEYRRPCLLWSERIFNGNLKKLIAVNEELLRDAEKDFGSIDLIHAHVTYPAGWVAMHLSEKMRIPYVISENMSPFPFPFYLNPDGSLMDKIKAPLEKASKIIAISPSLRQILEGHGIRNVVFVPHLVDESYFSEIEDSAEKEGFIFFTLGGLVEQKGIPDLLRAAQLFLARVPGKERARIRFRIGGEGARGDEYKSLANALSIDSNIDWLGGLNRKEVKEELQSCDCFVLTSHHETFGVVYAEAIACGKPIIATRCGGPECIVTPQNGLLIDVGNVKEISEALAFMVKNLDRYSPRVIRNQFMERFSREAVVSQLEAVYQDVVIR